VGSRDSVVVVTEDQESFRWNCPANGIGTERDWEIIDASVTCVGVGGDGTMLAVSPAGGIMLHQAGTKEEEQASYVHVSVSTDGLTKVLRITSGMSSLPPPVSSSSSVVAELKQRKKGQAASAMSSPWLGCQCLLPSVCVALVDDCSTLGSAQRPMLFVLLEQVAALVIQSDTATKFELGVQTFQVDNPASSTNFPVVAWNEQTVEGGSRPPKLLHLNLCKRASLTSSSSSTSAVQCFEYVQLLLPSVIRLQIEERMLLDIMAFVDSCFAQETSQDSLLSARAPWPSYVEAEAQQFLRLSAEPDGSLLPPEAKAEAKDEGVAGLEGEWLAAMGPQHLYFQQLDIGSIRTRVSFSASTTLSSSDSLLYKLANQHGARGHIIKNFSALLLNLDRAPITLERLVFLHQSVSADSLLNQLSSHYTSQLMGLIPKLMGSLQFLGNPVGLFNDVSSGLSGLINKPTSALGTDLSELGMGVLEGTGEFVASTVSGVGNSLGAVSNTIGTGVSVISRDKDFKRERAKDMQVRPKNFFHGVALGGERLGKGLLSGVSGLVTTPMKGATKGGVTGFFKGVAQGVIDLPAKPVIGFFDAATQVTRGISNSMEMDTQPPRINNARVMTVQADIHPADWSPSVPTPRSSERKQ